MKTIKFYINKSIVNRAAKAYGVELNAHGCTAEALRLMAKQSKAYAAMLEAQE